MSDYDLDYANLDGRGSTQFGTRCESQKPKPLQPEFIRIDPAKPKSHYNHYSNPDSQGAMMCQTNSFPDQYNPNTHSVFGAYSDRIQGWDSKRWPNALLALEARTGSLQGRLDCSSDKQVREFAKVALDIPVLPEHVRVIHWFNVSSGYSCPAVEAVFRKQEKEGPQNEQAKIQARR